MLRIVSEIKQACDTSWQKGFKRIQYVSLLLCFNIKRRVFLCWYIWLSTCDLFVGFIYNSNDLPSKAQYYFCYALTYLWNEESFRAEENPYYESETTNQQWIDPWIVHQYKLLIIIVSPTELYFNERLANRIFEWSTLSGFSFVRVT